MCMHIHILASIIYHPEVSQKRCGKELLMIYHLPRISKSLRRHAGWCCGNFFGMPIVQLKISSYIQKIIIQHTTHIMYLTTFFCICHISCLMCIYIYVYAIYDMYTYETLYPNLSTSWRLTRNFAALRGPSLDFKLHCMLHLATGHGEMYIEPSQMW